MTSNVLTSKGKVTSHALSHVTSKDDVRVLVPLAPEYLSLLRKVGMCAGLLFSEAMGVFSTLFILPLLQTLGAPMYILTLPGVISASAGLAVVPLLGWVSDGGAQPHKRKKPAVVVTFVIGILGLGLNLGGTVLHFTAPSNVTSGNMTPSGTAMTTSGMDMTSSGLNVTPSSFATLTTRTYERSSTTTNTTALPDESTEIATTDNNTDNSAGSIGTQSSYCGIPTPAVLGMAGFVLMDLGFDLANCAVKTLMLSHSRPDDHVSLLIIGVLVSSFGGCFTSVSGIVDLSNILPSLDPFFCQLLLQLVFLIAIGVLTCIVTLACTPRMQIPQSALPPTKAEEVLKREEEEEPESMANYSCSGEFDQSFVSQAQDDEEAQDGEERQDVQEIQESVIMATVTLCSEAQENMIMAATNPVEAMLGTSTQVERSMSLAGMSVSLGLAHLYASTSSFHYPAFTPSPTFTPSSTVGPPVPSHIATTSASIWTPSVTFTRDSGDTARLLPSSKMTQNYSTILEEESTPSETPVPTFRDNPKLKLSVIWVLAFFTACCVFIFSVTIADYLGKVIFGGDPEADVNSEAHAQYAKGLRAASLCTLVLSSTYVIFSFFHSKLLAALGPKVEYAIVSCCVLGLLVAVRMTANMWVIYFTAASIGLYRAEMYTIPFMLASQLCRQSDAQSVAEGGHPKVGSTMALVTCALPSAYLVVSSVVGPLIDATGEPSTPMLLGMACSCLAAFTIFLYKT